MSKEPDFKAIATQLIGEEPLDYKFNSEFGILSVINQIGQKFLFPSSKWQKFANHGSQSLRTSSKSKPGSTPAQKSQPQRSRSPKTQDDS